MITRIVKMTFIPEKVEDFLKVFNESKDYIRSYPGCIQMQLLKDIQQDNIYYTYSHWESEEALNHYRNSSKFREIWMNTKVNFQAKAEATSLFVTEY
jgi:heme-degrading monooxygenase HmoA